MNYEVEPVSEPQMPSRSIQAVYAAVLNQPSNATGIGTHDIADQAVVCYSTAVRLLNQLKAEGKVHSIGSKHKLWFPLPSATDQSNS